MSRTYRRTRPVALALVLLTSEEVSEMLSISPRTLEGWRTSGEGPKYIRIGGRAVRYRLEDIQAWVDANTHQHTAAEGAE